MKIISVKHEQVLQGNRLRPNQTIKRDYGGFSEETGSKKVFFSTDKSDFVFVVS